MKIKEKFFFSFAAFLATPGIFYIKKILAHLTILVFQENHSTISYIYFNINMFIAPVFLQNFF